jgi:hypothetical protein
VARSSRNRIAGVLAAAAALAASCALAPAAGAGPFAGRTIDGPSPAILGGAQVAMARDGTAAVVYLRLDAGVPHVFGAMLVSGRWLSLGRLDNGLDAPADQPTVAAGNLGRAEFAFLSGGSLFGVVVPGRPEVVALVQPRPAGPQLQPTAPTLIAPAAATPSAAMSQHGQGYVAFTVPAVASTLAGSPATSARVRVVWLARKQSSFTLTDPLNVNSGANAGDGPLRRPRLAASSDGSAEVAWGEDGGDGRVHVFARRVVHTAISTAPQDLTVSGLGGHAGHDGDSPALALEDNGSLGWAVFRQAFDDSGGVHTRALQRRLVGSAYDPPGEIDGQPSAGSEGVDAPSVALSGLGEGLTAVGLSGSRQVFAAIGTGDAFARLQRVDSGASTIPAEPAVAMGAKHVGMVAWVRSSGPTDPPSVHARVLRSGKFGPELVLSRPTFGPVDGTQPLTAGADRQSDVLVCFVEGTPDARRIVVGGLTKPAPGKAARARRGRHHRRARASASSLAQTSGG